MVWIRPAPGCGEPHPLTVRLHAAAGPRPGGGAHFSRARGYDV